MSLASIDKRLQVKRTVSLKTDLFVANQSHHILGICVNELDTRKIRPSELKIFGLYIAFHFGG